MLLVAFASSFLVFGDASPCPTSSLDSVSIVSNTQYVFRNCSFPVSAAGTDVQHVMMRFLNATFGGISLTGAFLKNFTLMVTGAEGVSGSIAVSATRVEEVAVYVALSRLRFNENADFLRIVMVEKAEDVSLSITDSDVTVATLLSLDNAANLSGLLVTLSRANISATFVLLQVMNQLLSSIISNISLLVSGTKL